MYMTIHIYDYTYNSNNDDNTDDNDTDDDNNNNSTNVSGSGTVYGITESGDLHALAQGLVEPRGLVLGSENSLIRIARIATRRIARIAM